MSLPQELTLAGWLVGLLALNGYFAAAGVALASVRRGRLKELEAAGQAGARAAVRLLSDRERLLSMIQVGSSASTLALGWVCQALFHSALVKLGGLSPDQTAPGPAEVAVFSFALLLTSFAHAVFAEMAPKNLALERAERWALLLSPPLLVLTRLFAPLIVLIERSTRAILATLGFRGEPLGGGEAAETLRLLISLHRHHGQLGASEESALQRMLDLQDHLTREIMVPRSEIVSLPADASLQEALDRMGERRLGRLPVYEGQPEQIVGVVCCLDLLAAWKRALTGADREPEQAPLRHLMRRPLVVPETKPLNQLLEALRQERSRMAIVVDEHGTVAGLVTLENVIEQILGRPNQAPALQSPAEEPAPEVLELDGATTLRELEIRFGIELPIDAGYETVAGFLLYRLGHIPQPGERVAYSNLRLTVVEMDKKRIARVRLERLPAEPNAAEL